MIKKGEIWQPLYIGGKWSDLFRLPGNALKVWLLHYSMEGKGKRRSWPTIETIMEQCDLSHNTVHTARLWLVENKWLVLVGYTEYGVPMYRVEKGSLPPKIGTPKNREGVVSKSGVTPIPKSGSQTRSIEPKPSEPEPLESLVSQSVSKEGTTSLQVPETEKEPLYYSSVLKRELTFEEHEIGSDLYLDLLPLGKMDEQDVITLVELAIEYNGRGDGQQMIRNLWMWNRRHKKEGLRWRTVQQMAKSLRSESDNSAYVQYNDHDERSCPICKKLQTCTVCGKVEDMTRDEYTPKEHGYKHRSCGSREDAVTGE